MITIDGGRHSGSGTILRYSVALATLLGQELHVENIRSKRPKPGLRRQHVSAILACCRISNGQAEGAEVSSREIAFRPGPYVQPGEYRIDVGSAGSTTLLAYSLSIPVLFAAGPCRFILTGGLFQDFAPSAFHMKNCLFPLLRRMGATIDIEVARPGYVPTGEGKLELTVEPLKRPLEPLELPEQGKARLIQGISLASNLSDQHVSERMAKQCRKTLKGRGLTTDIRMLEENTAAQRGAALAIWTMTDAGAVLGADMAGASGRPSERIGKSVANLMLEDLATGATVDRHLADQLIVFAALANGTTTYRIPRVTDHVESNLWLVKEFLGAKTEVDGNVVMIEGIGFSP